MHEFTNVIEKTLLVQHAVKRLGPFLRLVLRMEDPSNLLNLLSFELKSTFETDIIILFKKKDLTYEKIYSDSKEKIEVPDCFDIISPTLADILHSLDCNYLVTNNPIYGKQDQEILALFSKLPFSNMQLEKTQRRIIKVVSRRLLTLINQANLPSQKVNDGLLAGEKLEKLSLENTRLKNQIDKRVEFFANMSHEIRTPLNTIVGLAQIVESNERKNENRLNDETLENIRAIESSSLYLLQLVNDYLDYSQINSGKVQINNENFNLPKMIENIALSFKAIDPSNEYIIKMENICPNYNGDKGKIISILNNLLLYASKNSKNETIRVHASNSIKNTLRISVFNTREYKEPIHFAKVFEEFGTPTDKTDFQCAGIGLTLVRKMTGLLKGKAWAHKNHIDGNGLGITVEVKVKKVSEVLPDREPTVENDTEKVKIKRILVVDDTPMNIFLMRKVFSNTDYQVEYTNGGHSAISLFKKHEFDLVLMDLVMPEINGQETACEIRKLENLYRRNPCRIMALTADGTQKIEDLKPFGIDFKMMKPFRLDMFRDALQTL